jgi:hypothetical protein
LLQSRKGQPELAASEMLRCAGRKEERKKRSEAAEGKL